MRAVRVLIAFNEPVLPPDHPDADSEHDILYTADVVSRALMQAGFQVSRLGLSDDPATALEGLRDEQPDVVFNLFEGTAVDGSCEAHFAGLLEWLRIPFTGSPAQALMLARSKPLTKQLLHGAGLPTAAFFSVEGQQPIPKNPLGWPVIVKPAREDASVGIEQGSVVTTQKQLEQRVALVQRRYGPHVLIEKFIRGREFNVGIIALPELRMLPVSEILFTETSPDYWPIVSFDAKWKPGTRDFVATPPVNPAPMDAQLAAAVESVALAAFRTVGCRDYARVDIRVDENNQPFILEVNPNPCISPLAGFAAGLESARIAHSDFLVRLVETALARSGRSRDVIEAQPAEEEMMAETALDRPAVVWKVRRARSSDREALRGIVSSCEAFSTEPFARTVRQLLDGPVSGKQRPADLLVASHRGRVGGFAAFRPDPHGHGVMVLEALAVAADLQGRGLGRRLLETVRDEAAKQGGRLLLAGVASHSAFIAARRFLQRHGFRLAGDVPDFYMTDYGRLLYVHYLAAPAGVVAPG